MYLVDYYSSTTLINEKNEKRKTPLTTELVFLQI